jgi:hypothetical protein
MLNPKSFFFALSIAVSVTSASASNTPEQIRAVIKKNGGPERLIAAIATNTAKISGQMIDDQTEITGALANGKTLLYYTRLVNYEKKDISDLAAARRTVAGRNAPSICTAPVSSILINEHNADYKYIAYSKSREYLFEYSFNKTTCTAGYRW